MHPTDQIQVRQDAYDAKDTRLHETGAERIICILLPASALVAATNGKNECISVRYSRHDKSHPEWDAAFYEKVLGNELMIRSRNATRYVFTATGKQLLIPEAMHQQEYSRHLLRDIFHIAPDEQVANVSCKADKAQMIFAFDHAVQEIAERYIGTTEIKPLNWFQFLKTEKGNGWQVNCLLTEREAYLTLRDNGRLQWHHAIPYGNAEDIAFHILHACREWDIPAETVQVHCAAIHPEAMDVTGRLKRFLPLADTGHAGRWGPVHYLLQQLGNAL